jgi:hypothetical protein
LGPATGPSRLDKTGGKRLGSAGLEESTGYPAPEVPIRIWAWEFLRRSPVYREFWQDKIQPFIDEDDHLTGNWWPATRQLKEEFGVGLPVPPWTRTPPIFVAESTFLLSIDETGLLQRISLEDDQIPIVFDISKSIKDQLERARELLEFEQRRHLQGSKIKQARARSDRYVTYLRILDAQDAGANRT